MKRIFLLSVVALTTVTATVFASTSAFESPPQDPRAVTVKAKADGGADDTDAIQQAIDKATEHSPGGLVFLPSGRYRITRSILVWPGVRIYGTGRTRPVLVLGNNTPGFEKGVSSMVAFVGVGSILVGWASFVWVERPLTRWARRRSLRGRP